MVVILGNKLDHVVVIYELSVIDQIEVYTFVAHTNESMQYTTYPSSLIS